MRERAAAAIHGHRNATSLNLVSSTSINSSPRSQLFLSLSLKKIVKFTKKRNNLNAFIEKKC